MFQNKSPVLNLQNKSVSYFVIFLQHHHSVGQGPREGRLRAHHQAVPQRARVHRERQLRHLQRLREDLGRGPEEPDRVPWRRRPPGGPARLRGPPGHRPEGVVSFLWPGTFILKIPNFGGGCTLFLSVIIFSCGK